MPYKKGQSGNPNGRPKPNPNKVLGMKVLNAAQGVPDLPREPNKRFSPNSYKWIPFGSDNLFPNALALIGRRSVFHRSIMYHKKNYVVPHKMLCKDNKVLEWIKSVNANDETLTEVMGKLYLDYQSGGNCYLEIVKNKGQIFFYHKDHTKARVKDTRNSTDKTPCILLHHDWRNPLDSEIVEIPLYPKFKKIDGLERSIYHFKDYESEYSTYGLPLFISALDVAAITWKTNKWNVSRLDNTFHSSGVMEIEGDYSADDVELLTSEIEAAYTGEENQGKLAIIVKQMGGGATKFIPFAVNLEGDWTNLHTQANKDLVAAHVWQRSLCNMSDAAQLGNTTLIRNEYGLASRIIQNDQMFFLNRITRILTKETNMDASSLSFVNISPVPITDLLDPNEFLLNSEKREAFGYEELMPEDVTKLAEEQGNRNNNGTNNSSTSN